MIPLIGGSLLNTGGGGFCEEIGVDLDDVGRLEVETDVAVRRMGGGESGCMGTTLPRSPEPFGFLRPVESLDRGRGGGVSPPND